jgi:O-antigen/teichoic acid export membrane protein
LKAAGDSPLKRLLVQTSHYSLASLLTTIAGLVSFPILTRTFSVADYGVMNLVSATLTASVAIGKFGIQHAIVRYRSEIASGKSQYSQQQLVSTTLIGMLASGVLTMLVVLLGAHFAPTSWLGDAQVRIVFQIVSILVLVQVLESVFHNFLRADQQTGVLMRYQVLKKYLGLALILFAIFVIQKTLSAFYIASVIGEAIAVVWLAWIMFRRVSSGPPRTKDFSSPLLRELLGFGIPMMIGYELAGIILSVGDRYVVADMIGQEPLGLYGAAYNLCNYVQATLIVSVSQAIMPIYMRIWDEKGAEATAAFIGRSMRTYVMLGVAVVAGLAAVGPELIPALSSERYASAATVLPWVMGGMVVDGTNTLVGAGLFITRKTRVIMVIVMSSALMNIVLNILLVPRYGINGSAVATLLSYGMTSSAMGLAARSSLHVKMPWVTLLRASVMSVVMYVAVIRILPGHHLLTVAVRAFVGAVIYVGLMSVVDPDARLLLRTGKDRVLRMLGRAPNSGPPSA